MRTQILKPMALSASVEPMGGAPRPAGPPLAPLLAGARARGVADGLEWLGLAAVMLDDRGEVLHVNAGAVELMGEDVFLRAGRLQMRDPGAHRALDDAIATAMYERASSIVSTSLGSGQGGLDVRVAPFGALDDDPYQLLRLVVILERREGARPASPSRH